MMSLNKYRSLLILLLLFLANVTPVFSKDWEPIKTEINNVKEISSDSHIRIKTAPSKIIIYSDQQVQIEVFTILGKLISKETLQPGEFLLEVPVHGIYIVKVGELTCKVAI